MDIGYCDLKNAFKTVFCKILIERLTRSGLDDQTVRWTKNCLHAWDQIVVISGMKTSWRPATSIVPEGSILVPILFDIFLNNLDNGTAYTIAKFGDDTNLGC